MNANHLKRVSNIAFLVMQVMISSYQPIPNYHEAREERRGTPLCMNANLRQILNRNQFEYTELTSLSVSDKVGKSI